MMHRTILCILFVLSALIARAQTVRTKPAVDHDHLIDTVLQVTNASIVGSPMGTTVPIEIVVHSRSPKTITAYAVHISAHYPNQGDWDTELALDLLRPATVPELSSDPPLVNDTTSRVKGFARLDRANLPPSYLTAEVSAVIFVDRTSLGNSPAIRVTLDNRKRESEYVADLLAELEDAQRAAANSTMPGNHDPLERLRRALEDRISQAPEAPTRRPEYKQVRVGDLLRFKVMLQIGKPAFDAEVSKYKKLQVTLAEHSRLKEGP